MIAALWLVSALVAFGRLTVPGHPHVDWQDSFEALAHIWVGVLITLSFTAKANKYAIWKMLGALTAFETIMFFVDRWLHG